MRVEARNLEEAFKKASTELNCSITHLEINIIQHPSRGFFGFFKKNAIIEVESKQMAEQGQKSNYQDKKKDKRKKYHKEHCEKQSVSHCEMQPKQDIIPIQNDNLNSEEKSSFELPQKEIKEKKPRLNIDNSIFEAFHKSDNDDATDPKEICSQPNERVVISEETLKLIKRQLDSLFEVSSFDIRVVEVSQFDDETVFIKLDGDDSALLIGKEGYRYKAISYLIFNWINSKFNYSIRLEISQFLKNQELAMSDYLSSIIERVEVSGKAQTKPLDGVLIKIALEQLRKRFPDKYVGIKNGDEGRYIVVNSFHKK